MRAGDIDAYVRCIEKEVELLRAEYARIEQARTDGDSDTETEALFAMTANGIDEAGASAAGMTEARYGFVKEQLDEIGSKLAMLDGLAAMEGDTMKLQAQVGDPYKGLEAPTIDALKARRGAIDALRGESIALRLKAAGG